MPLWMMIYLAGKLVGTVGPLPYGIEECQMRAVEKLHEGDPTVVTPEGFTLKDVAILCEFHPQRPTLTPDSDPSRGTSGGEETR